MSDREALSSLLSIGYGAIRPGPRPKTRLTIKATMSPRINRYVNYVPIPKVIRSPLCQGLGGRAGATARHLSRILSIGYGEIRPGPRAKTRLTIKATMCSRMNKYANYAPVPKIGDFGGWNHGLVGPPEKCRKSRPSPVRPVGEGVRRLADG